MISTIHHWVSCLYFFRYQGQECTRKCGKLLTVLTAVGMMVSVDLVVEAKTSSPHSGAQAAANRAPALLAASPQPARRQNDEFWVVSTRHLGCAQRGTDAVTDLRFSLRKDNGPWIETTISDYEAEETTCPTTIIYVHGNRANRSHALARGQDVYRKITQKLDLKTKIRFVIWSWPSTQKKGLIHDFRVKAHRTNSEGFYLGEFLSARPPETQISLIGFSYGARVVTGATHVMGGGKLAGRYAPDSYSDRDVRVVLIAAALHTPWLYPGNYHSHALKKADQALLLFNNRDAILKRYWIVEEGRNPSALGYTGLDKSRLGSAAEQFKQINVCRSIRKEHAEATYWGSTQVIKNVRKYVLWEPVD